MRSIQLFIIWIILILTLLSPRLHAQDTTGFNDSTSIANAFNPSVEWRESWYSGQWYNLSFVDGFSFEYRFYADGRLPSHEELISFSAYGPAVGGDFRTGNYRPQFMLVGYVVEDSTWCLLTATLDPAYIQRRVNSNIESYGVEEEWYTWREVWTEGDSATPKEYEYDETLVNHNLNVWGRLPPHREIEVWWGCDAFMGWTSVVHDSMLNTAEEISVASPFIGDSLTYYANLDSYMVNRTGMWCQLGTYTVDGPGPPPLEEPPGWAECTFEGYVDSDTNSVENWLPSPDGVIGLKFKFERTLAPMSAMIRYNIYSISTWQGECMNYPSIADFPEPTGTGLHFDFTIVDTEKYDIEIMDFDTYDGYRVEFIPENPGEKISTRRYVASVVKDFEGAETVMYDILWLKAHDYGAKAIISPTTGATMRDLMRLRTTEFGQAVWNVSVPRDDDGRRTTGYNYGDFMADAWEETVLGVPAGNQAVIDFTPFYQKENGVISYTDQDASPKGREINGDGFCNWEEYRGFQTVGDQSGFYPSSEPEVQHKRLNPFLKNPLIYFMSDAEIYSEVPGYIEALPDNMVYLVDQLTPLDDDDSTRKSLRRWVNINKWGASYPYFSSLSLMYQIWGTTSCPAAPLTISPPENGFFQNAVVFWSIYSDDDSTLMQNEGYLGYNYSKRAFEVATTIPNLTKGIVIDIREIASTFDTTTSAYDYYSLHPDSIAIDSIRFIHFVIAHELGHSIAMPHDISTGQLMPVSPAIDVDWDGRWRIGVAPPDFSPTYSNESINKISIRKEE